MLVLAAGVAAGAINTVVGSGTLITFPTLLAVGLPPVTANVSNSMGLFPGNLTGAYGYREELRGQGGRLLRLGPATAVGALIGAILLLTLPASAFHAIVPVLIGAALALVVFGSRISKRLASTRHSATAAIGWPLIVVVFTTGIYGGYFGAAQGVLLMGFMGVLLDETLQRQNAIKNVLAGLGNFVAAVVFALTTHIDWTAAGLIAAGSICGGLIGARVGRRLPPAALRVVIVVVGIAAIVKLLA